MSEIKIANRLLSGALTLIFSVLFAFVFVEERQRGLAIAISIPLAISLIWYAYSRFMDSDRPNEKTEYSGIKKIVGVLAIITIISTVASFTTKSRIGILLAILFLMLIIIYEIVDYIEVSHLHEQKTESKEVEVDTHV